jgi:hypothetical protein
MSWKAEDNIQGQSIKDILEDLTVVPTTTCLHILTKIFIFRKNYFCQLLDMHGVNSVRQTEIHTAESLLFQPSYSESETATEKL